MPETLPAWLTHAWLSVPLPVALGLLVAAFALHGRGVGAGVMGARSAGSVALLILCHGLAGIPGALMALGWAISRTTKLKNNAATPSTQAEFVTAAVRWLPAIVAAGICAVGFGRWPILPAEALAVAVSVGLAGWYGDRKAEAIYRGVGIKASDNVLVEAGQGAATGLAIGVGLLLL